jgi:hypothetical protein
MNSDNARCCAIVELRQYTLHPGRFDEFAKLFEDEFVDPLEEPAAQQTGRCRLRPLGLPAIDGDVGDGVAPVAQQAPERIRARRSRQAAGESDDGNGSWGAHKKSYCR